MPFGGALRRRRPCALGRDDHRGEASGRDERAHGGPGAKIRIGAAFGAAAFPDDARKIGATDGFAIRRRGDDLYLFGTKPRASVYAVATLLEENTDIIWARPSEDFETVFTPPEGAVWVRVWIYDGTLEYVRITDGAMYL